MLLEEKWADNLILLYIEGDTTDPDGLDVIWVTFSFYNYKYTASVSSQDIENDDPMTALEGDSELFESFEKLIESSFYWPKLKECFSRYKNYLIKLDHEY